MERIVIKTFRSKRYGFEIDIPEDWSCPPTSFISRLLGVDKNLNFKGSTGELINIQIGSLFPEPSLKDTEIEFRRYAEDLGYSNVETSIIQVGSKNHFCARYVMGKMRPDSGILWYMKDTGMLKETPEVPRGLVVVVKKYCLVFKGIEYAITCRLGIRVESDKEIFWEEEALYDAIVSTFRLIET